MQIEILFRAKKLRVWQRATNVRQQTDTEHIFPHNHLSYTMSAVSRTTPCSQHSSRVFILVPVATKLMCHWIFRGLLRLGTSLFNISNPKPTESWYLKRENLWERDFLEDLGVDGRIFNESSINRMEAWTGQIWPSIRTGAQHLWTRRWSFVFHKMWRISWLAKELLASQEGLWLRDLFGSFVRWLVVCN
jgi:hypothetical protein